MKHLLLFSIVFALLGCESINIKKAATDSVNYADLRNTYQPCFIIDEKLSNYSTVITTPKFMDNSYGFMVENHFKDNAVILEVGEMIEDDIHALSNEMFGSQCFISSLSEFTGQGNLIIKVDLVTSNISEPKNYDDKIVSQVGVLYSVYDAQGHELFKKEVIEQDDQEAFSAAAYRQVTNKTVDRMITSSKALILQSLRNIK